MPKNNNVIVIGGGIAGLCAAVYAQRCGYQTDLFEMHDSLGGLATSWRRGDYTFETCLHWLLGSNPNSRTHSKWQEVFDIDKLKFVRANEFIRVEDQTGDYLSIYSNLDQLEAEMLRRAPQDEVYIRQFISDVRKLGNFELPDPSESWLKNCHIALHDARYVPLFWELSRITSKEYAKRFTDPLIRLFFEDGDSGRLCVLALLFSLAWMNNGDASYPIGGSQAVIRPIAENFASLGGTLHLSSRVQQILVENDRAVGVRLSTGETFQADWVISAADGHATIFDMLDGKYTDREIEHIYTSFEPFPSYVQVSLGVAKDLSGLPGFLSLQLSTPLQLDPITSLSQLSFRIFHYDPTFAPFGKTAVTCFLPTYNFQYWTDLRQSAPLKYEAEKQRIANQVISIFEKKIPNPPIEVIDVATPATVIRVTANWQGSMEGWFLTPRTGFRQLPKTLPGLSQFLMAGHWIEPGGGLPAGLFTARAAVSQMCKEDGVRFPFN
jgi:phytoene dehydrogenase-like protein